MFSPFYQHIGMVAFCLENGYRLLEMAFNFMLFFWEDKSTVLVGLVKISRGDIASILHLHGVGSVLCGLICGVLRKLGNTSSTPLLHSLKPPNVDIYSFGLLKAPLVSSCPPTLSA